MKKIRLVDQTEIEIYNITESGSTLCIDILNGDANAMETAFSDSDNLTTIQYFVGTDLVKGYACYTKLQNYQKRMDQVIATDYATPDATMDSGFAETKADILTVVLDKPAKIDAVESETEQLRADVDYLYMESGVV